MQKTKKKITWRTKIYIFIITAGLICIFYPAIVAHADFLGTEIQDLYARITENVSETNDILNKAFEFSKTSPYDVVNSICDTLEPDEKTQANIAINFRTASQSVALAIAVLLLMVDFFRKSTTFEWSSKWENILMFIIKVIVVKQVVQNSDVIINHIYALFDTINNKITTTSIDFLPCSNITTYTYEVKESLIERFHKPFFEFIYDEATDNIYKTVSYDISKDAVQMFYPKAEFPDGTDLNRTPFTEPTSDTFFMPTIEKVLLTPYFLVLKAIAYIIFVIGVGRVFELTVYTIFAPLPLATFASETTNDVAKNFIKNYIASVLQIAVIVVMFIVYSAVTKTLIGSPVLEGHFKGTKGIEFIILISLALGVVKSGTWSKKICGVA